MKFRRSLSCVVAASIALATAGSALALTPKEGTYASLGPFEGASIAFKFKGSKIREFLFSQASGCYIEVAKIPVKENGKFKFNGTAPAGANDATKVTIKGKFVSKKKADLTISAKETPTCDVMPDGYKTSVGLQ